MVKTVALLAVLASGCSRLPDSIHRSPELDQLAISLVWNVAYGMTAPAPEVEWISEEAVNCYTCNDPETCAGVLVPAAGCRRGYTVFSPDGKHGLARILYLRRYSRSVLSHELLHAKVALTLQVDADPGHTLPLWSDGTVEAADTLLEDNDL